MGPGAGAKYASSSTTSDEHEDLPPRNERFKTRRRVQTSTDALRASHQASRAGLELLGVHGQLHDHLAKVHHLESRLRRLRNTLELLRV